MRRPGGYAVWDQGGRVVREQDTFTCGHCMGIIAVVSGRAGDRADPRLGKFQVEASDVRMCPACSRTVCGHCAALKRCLPFERRIEEQEARGRALVSMGVPQALEEEAARIRRRLAERRAEDEEALRKAREAGDESTARYLADRLLHA